MSEWIKCGERMPAARDWVLVSDGKDVEFRMWADYYRPNQFVWQSEDSGRFENGGHWTHWMPLPEPPYTEVKP